jgi:hypothetical protein
MAVRRVLIIANETVADVAAIPEVVRKIAEAEEVCVTNWQERQLTMDLHARFGLPVTEILLDRGGRVAAVGAE